MQENYVALLQAIADLKTDLLVVFKASDIVLTNNSFNNFFGVKSLQEYNENFGDFVENFVPHPSYFNKEKMQKGTLWFDAIMELEENQRIVSILSRDYEPYAFSVSINRSIDGFIIASFTDITQSLIKRLMIENNANIDAKSGAYAKQYFLQIMQLFEEAALFNEKLIAVNHIELSSSQELDVETIKEFVQSFKNFIREDDMLVRWTNNEFLLVYLIDTPDKVELVTKKIQSIQPIQFLSYQIKSSIQIDKENIHKIIAKLN